MHLRQKQGWAPLHEASTHYENYELGVFRSNGICYDIPDMRPHMANFTTDVRHAHMGNPKMSLTTFWETLPGAMQTWSQRMTYWLNLPIFGSHNKIQERFSNGLCHYIRYQGYKYISYSQETKSFLFSRNVYRAFLLNAGELGWSEYNHVFCVFLFFRAFSLGLGIYLCLGYM